MALQHSKADVIKQLAWFAGAILLIGSVSISRRSFRTAADVAIGDASGLFTIAARGIGNPARPGGRRFTKIFHVIDVSSLRLWHARFLLGSNL